MVLFLVVVFALLFDYCCRFVLATMGRAFVSCCDDKAVIIDRRLGVYACVLLGSNHIQRLEENY